LSEHSPLWGESASEASWWGALILVSVRPLRSLVAMAYRRAAGPGNL